MMENELKDLTFEEWVKHIFDHPIPDAPFESIPGYYLRGIERWDEKTNPKVSLKYLTNLFENAKDLLESYNDEQVEQGLTYLIRPDVSGYMFILRDDKSIPFDIRKQCIDSMYILYVDLFGTRCSVGIEPRSLNILSYHWWETIPIYPIGNDIPFEMAYIDMMERALYIRNLLPFGTVNSLERWLPAYPKRIADIMTRLLASDIELKSHVQEKVEQLSNGQHHHLNFDEWVRYVFDHDTDRSEGHWSWQVDDDFVWWDELKNPSITIGYLTRLFENAVTLLAPYSDEQIKQGLWFIGMPAHSDHLFAYAKVTKDEQLKFLEAMYQLYAKFFTARCSKDTFLSDKKNNHPINGICYIWWDLIPILPRGHDAEADRAFMDMMERILYIDNELIQYATAHYLILSGFSSDPKYVAVIMKRFLNSGVAISDKVRGQATAINFDVLSNDLDS